MSNTISSMTGSLRDVVAQGLRQAGLTGYDRQAQPIIQALETREAQIADACRRVMAQRGMQYAEVEQILFQVGLASQPSTPTPTMQAASATPGEDLGVKIDRLFQMVEQQNQTVTQLTEFARTAGYRG